MKKLLLFFSLLFNQSHGDTPVPAVRTVVVEATTSMTVVVKFFNTIGDGKDLNVYSTDSVYFDHARIGRQVGSDPCSVFFIDLDAGETVTIYGDPSITYSLFQADGVTPIVFAPDNQTPSFIDSLDKRSAKMDRAMVLLMSATTKLQFDTVVNLLSYHIYNFRYRDVDVVKWVRGLAPYAANGFPTKSYYTIQRRDKLLNILQ